jgi:hypothetical protein
LRGALPKPLAHSDPVSQQKQKSEIVALNDVFFFCVNLRSKGKGFLFLVIRSIWRFITQ